MSSHVVKFMGGPKDGETMAMPGHPLESKLAIFVHAPDPDSKRVDGLIETIQHRYARAPVVGTTGPLRYDYIGVER